MTRSSCPMSRCEGWNATLRSRRTTSTVGQRGTPCVRCRSAKGPLGLVFLLSRLRKHRKHLWIQSRDTKTNTSVNVERERRVVGTRGCQIRLHFFHALVKPAPTFDDSRGTWIRGECCRTTCAPYSASHRACEQRPDPLCKQRWLIYVAGSPSWPSPMICCLVPAGVEHHSTTTRSRPDGSTTDKSTTGPRNQSFLGPDNSGTAQDTQ